MAQTESACNAGDSGSVPGSGISPGERNSYPLQYSCLENSMHGLRSLEGYSPWGHKPSDMTKGLFYYFFKLPPPLFFWLCHVTCKIFPDQGLNPGPLAVRAHSPNQWGLCAKSLQWCPPLCDSMGYSPPGSSVHGTLQAEILGCYTLLQEIFLTQGSTHVSYVPCIGRWILYHSCNLGNLVHGSFTETFATMICIHKSCLWAKWLNRWNVCCAKSFQSCLTP